MIKRLALAATATCLLLLLTSDNALGITASLEAAKDNTLYESLSGHLSNGAGPGFFAGVTGEPRITRGLIMFDVAAELPADAMVTSATLTLHVSKVAETFADTIEIRRVSTDWGEAGSIGDLGVGGGGAGGAAQAGDATWVHSFSSSSFWSSIGGDYVGTTSAAAGVGDVGFYDWSSSQMVIDVQDMLDIPNGNFGWIVLGNEVNSRTAKRFDSREHVLDQNRPMLTIEYELPGGDLSADFDGDDDVDGDDLNAWASSFGAGNGGDADADNDTDGSDYLVWQTEFTGPAGLQTTVVPEPSAGALSIALLVLGALNRRDGAVDCRKARK